MLKNFYLSIFNNCSFIMFFSILFSKKNIKISLMKFLISNLVMFFNYRFLTLFTISPIYYPNQFVLTFFPLIRLFLNNNSFKNNCLFLNLPFLLLYLLILTKIKKKVKNSVCLILIPIDFFFIFITKICNVCI